MPSKEEPIPKPTEEKKKDGKKGVVASKYPNHLWEIDLTTVPIGPGFWMMWPPFSLPQCWPFGWWIGVVMDLRIAANLMALPWIQTYAHLLF